MGCDASLYPGVSNRNVKSLRKGGLIISHQLNTYSMSLGAASCSLQYVWHWSLADISLHPGLYLSDILNRVFYRSCVKPVLIFSSPRGHKWSDCLAGIWRGQSSWYLTFLPTGPSRLSTVAGPQDSGSRMNWTLKHSAPRWQCRGFIRHIKHAGMWNWLLHLTGKANDVWKVHLATGRCQWKWIID